MSICIILLDGKCTPNERTRNKMTNLIIINHDSIPFMYVV